MIKKNKKLEICLTMGQLKWKITLTTTASGNTANATAEEDK